MKKINEFNQSVAKPLSTDELAILEKGLQASLSSIALPDTEVLRFAQALAKVLDWPNEQVFPGLDILRLALLWPGFAQASTSFPVPVVLTADNLIPFAMSHAGLTGAPPTSPANQMLAFRVIANSFQAQAAFGPMRFLAGICDGLTRITITDMSVAGQLAVATAVLK